ncbi:MAG: metal-dependent hydrolase [Pseudomonadales bacterium]
MDSLTQAAVGAALAVAVSPMVNGRYAQDPEPSSRRRLAGWALAGAVGGLVPDLDVFIRSSDDPLLALQYHRQFTHALIMVPVLGLLVAVLVTPILKRSLLPVERYVSATIGVGSHGLLDACTSYGTALFWPFADPRIALSIVSIVDPLFTLPLIVLLVFALGRIQPRWAVLACAWAAFYLTLGGWQASRAESAARALAQERGHAPERVEVKPSFGNLLLWKSVYGAQGFWWVDAVRAGRQVTTYSGDRAAQLDPARDLPWLTPASRQARDLERFSRFSGGFVALVPGSSNEVMDVRYSMVPNQIDPLWGITLARVGDAPTEFWTSREMTPEHRAAFLELLR